MTNSESQQNWLEQKYPLVITDEKERQEGL